MSRCIAFAFLCAARFSLLGYGSQSGTSAKAAAAPDSRYVLQAEPTGAVGVIDFKEQAKTEEPVAVVGRVGGGIDPWIKGRAAFMLVDEGAPMPCEDDHCEACAKEIAECAMVVKFTDPQGKILPIDSRELLGIKEEETVVVKGVARRDDDGNVAFMAESIYVKR